MRVEQPCTNVSRAVGFGGDVPATGPGPDYCDAAGLPAAFAAASADRSKRRDVSVCLDVMCAL